MIRILVVDDHPIMRFGVAAIIGVQTDMQVVAQAGTGEEAIDLFEQFCPDLTLMDLQLPGMSGVSTIREIRARHRDAKFVVLTTYKGDEDIFQALRAGASGYLIKGLSHTLLVEAIRCVCRGKRYLPPEVSSQLGSRTPDADLSPREREVLSLIAEGNSNKEIAQKLGVTEGTIKCHVRTILGRLQVEDRTNAVIAALHRGLVHF
jgi:DNA-binding NarL/FixJ family response regulator